MVQLETELGAANHSRYRSLEKGIGREFRAYLLALT